MFKESASSCIALCAYLDKATQLLVYLLYKHTLLESFISGDASKLHLKPFCLASSLTCVGFMYWRQHGDLVSMTTALGLHRDADSGQGSLPFPQRSEGAYSLQFSTSTR